MTSVDAVLPDLNALDFDALKALVIATHTELISHKNEIESLKLLILKLKRMQFGPSSEKLGQQIDQLELQLEDLEVNRAAQTESAAPSAESVRRKPARRPLPADLPRETENLDPKEKECPDCGGNLNRLGEDVSETLEYVPEHFKVIRTVRPKLCCTRCDCIVQAPAPQHKRHYADSRIMPRRDSHDSIGADAILSCAA